MKKQLDANAMINELRGNSAFFPKFREEPVPDKTLVPPAQVTSKPAPQPVPPVRVVPLVPPVLPVPPGRGTPASPKRVMKQRHPFDIYQDQYESLQQIALEERSAG
jgi:hypothetical protein